MSIGPLFDWSDRSGPFSRSGGSGPSGDTSAKAEGFSAVPAVRNFPDLPDLSVRTFPDRSSEILNDSAEDPRSGIHPYGENNSGPFAPHVPLSSPSAAGKGGPHGGASLGPEHAEDLKRAPTLRPYQLEALAGIDARHESGSLRTLLELPTGCGKTVVFARWAALRVSLGRRVLVLAHRSELLEQAHRKLTDVGVLAGIEQADRRAGHAPVVVASVQTLQGARLKRLRPDDFDVVIDEAHHATAASYRKILEHFPRARVVGVTATPDRADGTALGEVFDSVAYRYGIREAIEAGYLARITARRIVLEGVDLSSVRSRAGDLAQDDLAAILGTEEAVHGVVGPLLEQTVGKRTIVFAVNVAHAKAIAEVINRHLPDAARAVDGSAPDYERKAIVGAFAAGVFQYLVNCALFTEGFDEPSIECVAIARPSRSRALVMQMVGRGTRLSPATGKAGCLWLDFTGNAGKHKLIGPIDALAAGEVPDDVRAEAERMFAEGEGDVDEVLEAAERELEERRQRAKVTASAKYFATEVDPFFGDLVGEPIIGPWSGEIATADERKRLFDLGWKDLAKNPRTTRGDAERIFAATYARKKANLCSYKQARILQKFGINAKTMAAGAAGKRLDILSSCDWDITRARGRLNQLAADELLQQQKDTGR